MLLIFDAKMIKNQSKFNRKAEDKLDTLISK